MYKVGDYIEVELYGQWHGVDIESEDTATCFSAWNDVDSTSIRPAQCSEPANTIRHMIANHDDGRYYE